jgi:ABC-type nitrate/sulfonate/bicarbonate transport system substrate-binding protein
VEYHVVSATTLHTFTTGKDPAAEVCVMPVNAAAKLLGDGSVYQMAAVLTHGNLYLLAENEGWYNKENLSDLIGKTVGVLQLNNVPGLTLKACLQSLGLPYNDLSGGEEFSDSAINLRAVSASPMVLSGADAYLLPSPEADWRVDSGNWHFVGDMQALYGDGNGYPQAVVVVKRELIESRTDWVRSLLSKIDEGGAWLTTAEKSVIAGAVQANLADGLMPKFTAETLTDGAIARSGIRLQRMDGGAVAEVKAFLQSLIEVDGKFAAMPSDDFYWLGDE